ncbi:MAG: AGE family epimerase/isomerase [Prolixibacteraceae bacterium]|nr:AGE family epimerase/isomerase [Prolixibacteraceae bacterium]MBN2774599.1 AGE family epimerase/isomerase [Prolixibacteraceae bacterium]
MNIQQLKSEFEKELNDNILDYWVKKVYDPINKTFFGRIDLDENPDPGHNKSAVLITRILWTFSAAYRLFPKSEYKQMADEAYRIITNYFWDVENGGIYWEIKGDHSPFDTKKQFYALAFCIYACTENYMAFKNEQAKQLAISLYIILEAKSFNPANGGYIDVLSRDYKVIKGLRLSEKEIADTMTMNTHLHVLEAYTNLFRIWKDDGLKQKLEHLINLFLEKIINHKTWHFNLFFNENWKVIGDVDSYGHDIEGTWLLYEAAEVLGKKELINKTASIAEKMAETTIREGIVKVHGGLLYEKENGHLLEEFHWWPQAEAVIGFFNLWQINENQKYFDLAVSCWAFIKNHIIDKEYGEWFWGVDKNLERMPIEKVNGWKAPYHNGRMCIEMIRRIEEKSK